MSTIFNDFDIKKIIFHFVCISKKKRTKSNERVAVCFVKHIYITFFFYLYLFIV